MEHEIDTGRYINKIYHRLRRNFWKEKEQFQLTAAQGAILSYILLESDTNKIYQKDVEKEFDLRASTATELLQTLEKKELIKRISDKQDGRYKILRATKKAEGIRESLWAAIHKKEEILTKGISEQELAKFRITAQKMLRNLEEWEDKI